MVKSNRRTETRQIKAGEQTYEVTTTQLRSRSALRLAPKLGRVIAPVLSKLRGIRSVASITERDAADLGPILEAAFAQLDDAAVDSISRELLADTCIVAPDESGTPRVIDLDHPTKIDLAFDVEDGFGLMLAVLKFAAEVNFGRYFFARARSTKETQTASA